jgi:N-acetylglucosamine-6-phosphate deacetylase
VTTATIVSASQVVTPYGVRAPGWIEVVGDHITEVRRGLPGQSDVGHPASILTPGFVDTHVHGGGGASFSTENAAEASRAVRTHLHHGTTTMFVFASLVTAPLHNLRRQVVALTALVRQGVLAGLHLGGPWLSPHFKGAHDRHALASPRLDDLRTLLDTAPGAIRMVTLAPELENGLEAVR